MRELIRLAAATTMALGFASAGALAADDVESFYRNRQVRLISGSAAGEHASGYEQLLARYMPRYIPGSPTIIVESQPGAGSLNAANAVYNVAARDGSVFGTAHGFVPLMPLFDAPGPKFDPQKFYYLGTMYHLTGLCIGMKRDGIATVEDLRQREVIVGTSGPATEILTFYGTMKAMLGAKLKVIYGYKASGDINTAMERGELQARCGVSWSAMKVTKPEWTTGADADINIVLQLRLTRDPELPDVPTLADFVTDPTDHEVLTVLLASPEMGFPFFLPPGVPPARAEAMRQAFMAASKDPDLLADAKKMHLDMSPMFGNEMQALIEKLYRTPDQILQKVRALATNRANP